jgi:hypothetical protein
MVDEKVKIMPFGLGCMPDRGYRPKERKMPLIRSILRLFLK